MRLIRSIEVERFRSLERVRLSDLSDVVALVGPNNCGKSNVLRALNLFFNDEVEPGRYLDLDRDYSFRAPPKKKKSIRVAVHFDLPPVFRFNKRLRAAGDYVGTSFWVRKTWTLDPFEPVIEFSKSGKRYTRITGIDADKVRQFLGMVSFRYIPNRAVPAEVIRDESRAIQRELARRVANYAKGEPDRPLRENLQRFAARMVGPIALDLTESCLGMVDVELATPDRLADMLAPCIFRASIAPAGKVEDTYLGAGVQALLMFRVLHTLVDSSEFRSFGWKQGAVWAVEEPESSLHRDLQVRLAALFREYALLPGSRFQIISTTHNEVFVQAASSGCFVGLDDGGGTLVTPEPIGQLTDKASTALVSGWMPPALKFLFQPVVIVEGDIDARVLQHAAELTGIARGVTVATVSQLDPALGGDGLAQVKKFVSQHSMALSVRLPRSPLLVLLDWEVSPGEEAEIARRYGASGSRYVRRWDPAWAHPRVGEDFRGIERFYSHSFLLRARQRGIAGIGVAVDGSLVLGRRNLGAAKARLAELFRTDAAPEDCEHLKHALMWMEEVASAAGQL